MITTTGPAARRRRGILAAAVLATGCGVVLLASAGTASAGNLIGCSGKVKPTFKKHPGPDATYSFSCSDDIRAFAIFSTKRISFFGTETTVTGGDPAHNQSAIQQCEGVVPSRGFSCGVPNQDNAGAAKGAPPKADCQGSTCNARVSANNVVQGEITLASNPCKSKGKGKANVKKGGKPHFYLFVTNQPLTTNLTPTGTTYSIGIYTAGPFVLNIPGYKKC